MNPILGEDNKFVKEDHSTDYNSRDARRMRLLRARGIRKAPIHEMQEFQQPEYRKRVITGFSPREPDGFSPRESYSRSSLFSRASQSSVVPRESNYSRSGGADILRVLSPRAPSSRDKVGAGGSLSARAVKKQVDPVGQRKALGLEVTERNMRQLFDFFQPDQE